MQNLKYRAEELFLKTHTPAFWKLSGFFSSGFRLIDRRPELFYPFRSPPSSFLVVSLRTLRLSIGEKASDCRLSSH